MLLPRGFPHLSPPRQIVQGYAEVVRQGAEIIEARKIYASLKSLILAVCYPNRCGNLHLVFFFLNTRIHSCKII